MKQVNEILNQVQKQTKSGQHVKPSEIAPELNGKLMETLWEKMADLYGYKFTKQFGLTPTPTWASCMTGISGQQMATGLRRCRDISPNWAVGAAEYRAYCLGKVERTSEEHRLKSNLEYEGRRIARANRLTDESANNARVRAIKARDKVMVKEADKPMSEEERQSRVDEIQADLDRYNKEGRAADKLAIEG